ncbi:MAG: YgiT-type zinc finger protein [Desulfobacterales bacterium]|nr:YgiT-type zinc finger protein [Desulfobacterales bacterium]
MKEGYICKACRSGRLHKREIIQKFEREGLEVSIDGIPALVCEKCNQIYFSPGIGDKISVAANYLFMLSEIKHAGEYRAAV